MFIGMTKDEANVSTELQINKFLGITNKFDTNI